MAQLRNRRKIDLTLMIDYEEQLVQSFTTPFTYTEFNSSCFQLSTHKLSVWQCRKRSVGRQAWASIAREAKLSVNFLLRFGGVGRIARRNYTTGIEGQVFGSAISRYIGGRGSQGERRYRGTPI